MCHVNFPRQSKVGTLRNVSDVNRPTGNARYINQNTRPHRQQSRVEPAIRDASASSSRLNPQDNPSNISRPDLAVCRSKSLPAQLDTKDQMDGHSLRKNLRQSLFILRHKSDLIFLRNGHQTGRIRVTPERVAICFVMGFKTEAVEGADEDEVELTIG